MQKDKAVLVKFPGISQRASERNPTNAAGTALPNRMTSCSEACESDGSKIRLSVYKMKGKEWKDGCL